ncbi:hypothetical protein CIPAW_03G020200 [Carya illinoinensis]|uniref:Uncharacterized protein n=1 Tax=Carya illinoinensis TaxID=32201 RepID=A0A8T1QVZ5_CARIL|nr:hypothetical protein CIPAW_03G020200 [Carya illinoinensis]
MFGRERERERERYQYPRQGLRRWCSCRPVSPDVTSKTVKLLLSQSLLVCLAVKAVCDIRENRKWREKETGKGQSGLCVMVIFYALSNKPRDILPCDTASLE